ncbi:hypothetical protein C0992_007684 [Termitomyces sp. T32_za158]|nr:hypothetical protein C0992_007684 [Termitomyces sp. T32_za158]
MESIQKWGNHLANLYWEAHLKPGHIPPEHKMESFIRSKYESKRWALEGPPPSNPSDLENTVRTSAPQPQHAQPSTSPSSHKSTASIAARAAPTTTRQPQAHPLLSTNFSTLPSQQETTLSSKSAPAPAPVQPKAPENDLFSLDFRAPTPSSPPIPDTHKKDVKQDILSLFSSPSAPAPSTFGQFGATPATSPWATQAATTQQQQQPTSMIGTTGAGAWGVSSGWGTHAAAPPPPAQNLWDTPQTVLTGQQQQSGLFNTSAVWGTSSVAPAAAQDPFGSFANAGTVTSANLVQPKKDDVFGDLWAGFK